MELIKNCDSDLVDDEFAALQATIWDEEDIPERWRNFKMVLLRCYTKKVAEQFVETIAIYP